MTDESNKDPSVDESNKIDPNEYAELKAENERLKTFHATVTKEKADAVAKAKAEADKIAREKAEADGNYKELLALKDKEYSEKLKAYEDTITKYENDKKNGTVQEAANKIANELAKSNVAKSKLLAEKLASRIKYTEEGLVVIDDKGKVISDKLDSLVDYAKKEFDFLCDGLQSTGGAGVQVVKPTGIINQKVLSPVDRMNLARNIK